MESVKITVEKSGLLRVLKLAGYARGMKTAMPIYMCYRLEITKSEMLVNTYDAAFVQVKAAVEIENVNGNDNGSHVVYVYGTTLKKLVELMPEGEVILTFYHSQMMVSSGKSSYMLPLMDCLDDMQWKENNEETKSCFTAEVPDMKKWLEKLSFCMEKEDYLRPALSGVLVDIKDGYMTMVATNARLLCRMQLHSVSTEHEAQFILPGKAVRVLKNVMPKVGFMDFIIKEKSAEIYILDDKGESVVMRIVGIEGKYPNYSAVIHNEDKYTIKLDRRALMDRLRRLALVMNDNSKKVTWKMGKENLMLTAADTDYQYNGSEEMAVECEKLPVCEEDRLVFGLNCNYTLGILQHLKTEKVVMMMNGNRSQGIIFKEDREEQEDELLYLVMTIMVDS